MEEVGMTVYPTIAAAAAEMAPEARMAEELLDFANALVIVDLPSANAAVSKRLAAKMLVKDLDDTRKRIVKPFNDGVSAINELFRPRIDVAKSALACLNAKIAAYDLMIEKQMKERVRAAEEERLRKETEARREAEAAAAEKAALLKAAEEAERAGKVEDAEDYKAQAADAAGEELRATATALAAPIAPLPVEQRAVPGITMADNWVCELLNLEEVILAAARAIEQRRRDADKVESHPLWWMIVTLLEFNQTNANAFARKCRAEQEAYGIRIVNRKRPRG